MEKTVVQSLLSLPAWGVWIEITSLTHTYRPIPSLPAWGVWIEIFFVAVVTVQYAVAPRMGSVD